MPLIAATWFVRLCYLYAALGVLLLPWWQWTGLRRLDGTTAHGSLGFRVLVCPGLVALWPFLLARALKGTGLPPAEHNAHRDAAGKAGQ